MITRISEWTGFVFFVERMYRMTLTEKVTTREIDGRIMKIMVPIMIEYSLMMLSSTILTSYIGRMAVDDISIYGMGTRIASIFFALFRGMGVGVMILEAQIGRAHV